MLWYILFGISLLGLAVGIIAYCRSRYTCAIWPSTMMISCALTASVLGLIILIAPISKGVYINAFRAQKAYIEAHIANDPVEDAAITSKKIELNDWLYEKQYFAKNYRCLSFFPDEYLSLTPIQ